MRIVTRPDFDGITCAVLLMDIFSVEKKIKWTEPHEIQNQLVNIYSDDILANLPYDSRCFLWFDHHFSNKSEKYINGSFKIAPSAASIINDYYKGKFSKNFDTLVKNTDKIDSANLSLDEILYPEKNKYILLSMTISHDGNTDEQYCNYLVNELRENSINQIMSQSIVTARCKHVVNNNILYKKSLKANTYCVDYISVSDFRCILPRPNGNRFLVHSIFPNCTVNIKIFFEKHSAIISVSKNILNKGCFINLGKMLIPFGGGGHDGAAACRFSKEKADEYLSKILDILLHKNIANNGI